LARDTALLQQISDRLEFESAILDASLDAIITINEGNRIVEWNLATPRISPQGLAFIAKREGLVTVAYPDGRFYSAGFGHNGPDVKPDSTISVDGAFELLARDLADREAVVNRVVKTHLKQHQFDAVLSLYYNAGYGPLAKMAELVNKRWMTKAAERFPLYCRVRADNPDTEAIEFVESAGLKKRRIAEQAMFQHGDYGDLSWVPFWDGDPFKTQMQRMPLPTEWSGGNVSAP
jgi:lysozyme